MGIGFDYGMGRTNVDRSNGIRFGVIPQDDVLQAWAFSSESVYPDPEPVECEACGGTGTEEETEHECEECGGTGEIDGDGDDIGEPLEFRYSDEGYVCIQSAGDSDIFIMRSPYFTRAAYCSPCAPGACYLMSPNPDGDRAYCFGHDWFDTGRAPYPVYRVDTGEEVPPPAKD
jgi:hypothetical protein